MYLITFIWFRQKNEGADKKRKYSTSKLPDGFGLGDHIQLLQIFEKWDIMDYDTKWCADNDLQACFYMQKTCANFVGPTRP